MRARGRWKGTYWTGDASPSRLHNTHTASTQQTTERGRRDTARRQSETAGRRKGTTFGASRLRAVPSVCPNGRRLVSHFNASGSRAACHRVASRARRPPAPGWDGCEARARAPYAPLPCRKGGTGPADLRTIIMPRTSKPAAGRLLDNPSSSGRTPPFSLARARVKVVANPVSSVLALLTLHSPECIPPAVVDTFRPGAGTKCYAGQ